jgi:pimeloyl-ACP methyl ester carboxylesterase
MSLLHDRRSILKAGGFALAAACEGIARAAAPIHITLTTKSGRAISVSRWRPAGRKRGTILFSHGALSSPAYYDLLIDPWVAAGHEVWAPLHVDSTDHPDRAAFAGPQGWAARMEDMHVLADHVGARQYIAAGHSFGGLVALTLGGASPVSPPGWSGPLSDTRASAVVAFSPPGPMPGLVEPGSYASVAVPALIQTGTADLPYTPPGTPKDPESWRKHLLAYEEPRLDGGRYALILDGVDHYFGGAICNFDRPGPRKVVEASQAAEIAALFMAAQDYRDKSAKARLAAQLKRAGPVMLLSR